MSARPGLLHGVTVADFGWAMAGPILGRFLAHHGATVIKIESNTRLDPTRMSPPFVGKPNRNASGNTPLFVYRGNKVEGFVNTS